jgi:hypothetical protein
LRPRGSDVHAHLSTLAARLSDWQSDTGVLGMLKEQLRYLARAVPDGGHFMREACRKTTTRDALAYVAEALGPVAAEGLDLDAGGGTLEQSGSAGGAEARSAIGGFSAEERTDCGAPAAPA